MCDLIRNVINYSASSIDMGTIYVKIVIDNLNREKMEMKEIVT